MLIRELMTKTVYSIAPDAAVKDAARIMRERAVSALPVCEGGRLVGILTCRDIVERATAEGLDPLGTTVASVMTRGVAHVDDDQEVHEAAWLMEIKRVRRLPVVAGPERRVVGVVTLGDLAYHLRDRQLGGEILEYLSGRERPDPTTGHTFSQL